jgi:hypothetical protein
MAAAPAFGDSLQKRFGPFRIGTRAYRVLVEHTPVQGDTSATGFRIVDDAGQVHFRHDYGRTPQDEETMTTWHVHVQPYGATDGQALSVYEQVYPSAPLSGAALRIFVPRQDRLVSLTPPITLYGEIGRFHDGAQYFEIWRYEFALVVPTVVNLSCTTADAACLTTRPKAGLTERLAIYDVRTDLRPIEQEAALVLYALPGAAAGRTVTVTPRSTVQVLEAASVVTIKTVDTGLFMDAEDDWLHVRIDGHEGWIRGSEDFRAIGLPSAG